MDKLSKTELMTELLMLLALERNYLAERRTFLAEFRTGLALALVSPSIITLIFSSSMIQDNLPSLIIIVVLLLTLTITGVVMVIKSYVKLRKTADKQKLLDAKKNQLITTNPRIRKDYYDVMFFQVDDKI